MNSKAEISDFPILFSFDDVGRFDVSMENIFVDKVFTAFYDLLDDLCGFRLLYFSLIRKICKKIAVRAILRYDKTFGIGFKNIVAANDVWMVQCFQYLYLICQHLHI